MILWNSDRSIDNCILLFPTEEYKEYILETSEFGGYNGKKLSNKNIELILLDPKQYKIRTNYNLNFFD